MRLIERSPALLGAFVVTAGCILWGGCEARGRARCPPGAWDARASALGSSHSWRPTRYARRPSSPKLAAAIVLARAGLARLGRLDTITEVLNYVQFHASDLLATFRRKVAAAKDLSRQDAWGTNPPAAPDAAVRWDGPALEATLEVGSGHYAAYPVDWKADRFEAEWDITFKQLELPGYLELYYAVIRLSEDVHHHRAGGPRGRKYSNARAVPGIWDPA